MTKVAQMSARRLVWMALVISAAGVALGGMPVAPPDTGQTPPEAGPAAEETPVEDDETMPADIPDEGEQKKSAYAQDAIVFDGRSWIEIPRLKYSGTVPLTVEAIVTPADPNADMVVFANTQLAGLTLKHRDGRWRFTYHGRKEYHSAVSPTPVVAGETVHLAGVFDGKHLTLYVDGTLCGPPVRVTPPHTASRYPFFIGADPHPKLRAERHFEGRIHGIRVTPKAVFDADFPPPTSLSPTTDSIACYAPQGVRLTKRSVRDLATGTYPGRLKGNISLLKPDPP